MFEPIVNLKEHGDSRGKNPSSQYDLKPMTCRSLGVHSTTVPQPTPEQNEASPCLKTGVKLGFNIEFYCLHCSFCFVLKVA